MTVRLLPLNLTFEQTLYRHEPGAQIRPLVNNAEDSSAWGVNFHVSLCREYCVSPTSVYIIPFRVMTARSEIYFSLFCIFSGAFTDHGYDFFSTSGGKNETKLKR